MLESLKKDIKGSIRTDNTTRLKYSHDTSLFEIVPDAVIFPRDAHDVQRIVSFVNAEKKHKPQLSITARSGGTDMSGGAINDSLIVDFSRHIKHIGKVEGNTIQVQPGAFYRDFEKVTLASGKLMPSYPASREICAVGGMVTNNSGGEKSLIYGKTENYVRSLQVILADGKSYHIKPLTKKELDRKMAQKNFEGRLYTQVFDLVDTHYDAIKAAKPRVSKNSTGYKIWDVWDRESGIFDMTQLFVGSQGTLGLITDIEFGLVDAKPESGLVVGYVESLDHLAEIVNIVVKHNPTSFETFDDYTFRFAMKFFVSFHKTLGWFGLLKLALSFIPDGLILVRKGIPKLLVMVEFEGENEKEIRRKIDALYEDLKEEKIILEREPNRRSSARFWLMRRESFNLLRKNVKKKHTAPFIDDVVVPTSELTTFLPKLRRIIDKYGLLATVAGHMGDGNFHVIPLMDLTKESEREKIEPALLEVIDLVKEHGGVISGEHNDGLIRGPFLVNVYGKTIMNYFKEVKHIFDPDNIFNPHKKTDATWDYSKRHIRDHF